jgi:hypothetical protein
MEQHEYARLVEYSLHYEPLSANTYTESHLHFAYVLQTENGALYWREPRY